METKITSYLVDSTLKAKITRKPPAKLLAETNKENSDQCEKEQIQSENKLLHEKIKEKDTCIVQLESKIESLNQTIIGLREEVENNKSSQTLVDKDKLLAIASCIFNNYATENHIANLNLKNKNEKDEEV